MQNQVNAEDELKSLRLLREAKEAMYTRKRATAKFVFIILGVAAVAALVYSLWQMDVAQQSRALAWASAQESTILNEKAGRELGSCNSDLEKLKVSLLECQNQNPPAKSKSKK